MHCHEIYISSNGAAVVYAACHCKTYHWWLLALLHVGIACEPEGGSPGQGHP